MSRGLKARFFLVFILSFAFLGIARAWVNVEVTDLSTGKKITTDKIRLSMTRNQISAFTIKAHYNRINDNPSIARLKVYTDKPNYNLPSYVENWTDKIDTLTARSMQMENTIFIRPIAPESVGLDSFRVEATLRYGLAPKDPLEADRLTVYLNVTEPQYPTPNIVPEPDYTEGTTNTVFWIPTTGASIQDIYFFDRNEDRKSVV